VSLLPTWLQPGDSLRHLRTFSARLGRSFSPPCCANGAAPSPVLRQAKESTPGNRWGRVGPKAGHRAHSSLPRLLRLVAKCWAMTQNGIAAAQNCISNEAQLPLPGNWAFVRLRTRIFKYGFCSSHRMSVLRVKGIGRIWPQATDTLLGCSYALALVEPPVPKSRSIDSIQCVTSLVRANHPFRPSSRHRANGRRPLRLAEVNACSDG
jgi:hypothetical protein